MRTTTTNNSIRCRLQSSNTYPPRRSITVRWQSSMVIPVTSTLSGSAWLPLQSSRGQTTSSSSSAQTTILACSSRSPLLSEENERRFLKRLVKWLKSWLKSFWDAVLVVSRSTEIAFRLSPLMILTPAAMASHALLGERYSLPNDIAWRYMISAMQALGPVAVKLCQWIATRRDIFPPNICDRLSVLHDRGYPHSWAHSHKALTESFGDYESKGLKIENVIGCGSAAQVYKGTLTTHDKHGKEHRREVAVKILHPRFQERINRDFGFIHAAADLLHLLPFDAIRMLNLPRATQNFGKILRLQADLTIEADNLDKFRENFYHHNRSEEERSFIVFPEPIEGWVSSKVLVEDFVGNAIPISDYLKDESEAGLEVRRELAIPLLRAFLKMTFIDNLIHADVHPGETDLIGAYSYIILFDPPLNGPLINCFSHSFFQLWYFLGNVLVKTIYEPYEPISKTYSSWFSPKLPTQSEGKKVKHSIVFLDAGIANSLGPVEKVNLMDLFRAVIFNNGYRAGELMVERAKYERCSQTKNGTHLFASGIDDIVKEFHERRKEGLTLGAVRVGQLLSRVLDLCRIHGVEVDPDMASVIISTLVLEGLGRSLEPNINLLDFAKPFVLGIGDTSV
jgi:aarF domain-containing kinase